MNYAIGMAQYDDKLSQTIKKVDKAIHIAPAHLMSHIEGDEEYRRDMTKRSIEATNELESFLYLLGEGSNTDLD